MTLTVNELAAASAGPAAGVDTPYAMLSVGDSIMWGQGLRPENRFRELVRRRIVMETGMPVAELAMGRSGAVLHPMRDPDLDQLDGSVASTVFSHPSPPIEEHYRPDLFSREIPNNALSTLQQLVVARRLMEEHFKEGPSAVRWILLDGGINDMGIDGFLAPLRAWSEGHFLSGWHGWILEEARRIREPMESVLEQAQDFFPQADIVVNGYFPVFSYWSAANIVRLQGVGVLHAMGAFSLFHTVTNLALSQPWGLDLLASASTAWQVASNHELRSAVDNVRRRRPERIVTFARSHIEGRRCLFSPDSWLWGYDGIPDRVPTSWEEFAQVLAGATPEDEVILERSDRCDAVGGGITCRMASIGHPNREGAIDYALSIIEALEEAGSLESPLGECGLAARRRRNGCVDFTDEARFTCLETEASVGQACTGAVTAVADGAGNQFRGSGDQLGRAGASLVDAAQCLADGTGAAANAAANQFSAAGDSFVEAGEHIASIPDCFDDTAERLQACDDVEAAEIAECNAAFAARRDGPCDIRCTSFTNCSSLGFFRRAACNVARAACVAANAAARGVCLAGAVTVREACRLAAAAKSGLCKAGVVGGNVVCAAGEVAGAAADVAVGVARVGLGGVAALGALGDGVSCALGRIGTAVLHTFGAAARFLIGVAFGIVAAVVMGTCAVGRWALNRSCRLGTWIVDRACRFGSAIIHLSCFVLTPLRATGRIISTAKGS